MERAIKGKDAGEIVSPLISIIIVSYNTKDYLKECLRSIKENISDISYEIIVVDNCSSDGTVDMIKKEFADILLVENKDNIGFAKANNQGMKISRGKFVLLLNPDTLVLPDSISGMVECIERNPSAGVVGCKLINPDGSPQYSWKKFKVLPRYDVFPMTKSILVSMVKKIFRVSETEKEEEVMEVDWVSGACALIRKDVLDMVGFFDEGYFMFYEDMDLGWRIKKMGYKV